MQTLESLFQTQQIEGDIGLITAHPDDDLSFARQVEIANQYGIFVHELILSLGTVSTKNFFQPGKPNFSVANGDRRFEGEVGAYRLGMASVEFALGQDGGIMFQTDELSEVVKNWTLERGIHTYATLGFNDHYDHIGSNIIAHMAALSLTEQEPAHPISILEIQHYSEGQYNAEITPSSVLTTFHSAEAHPSQIPIAKQQIPGWTLLPTGSSIDPIVRGELQIYPIGRDASYIFKPAGSLAMHAMIAQGTNQ